MSDQHGKSPELTDLGNVKRFVDRDDGAEIDWSRALVVRFPDNHRPPSDVIWHRAQIEGGDA